MAFKLFAYVPMLKYSILLIYFKDLFICITPVSFYISQLLGKESDLYRSQKGY